MWTILSGVQDTWDVAVVGAGPAGTAAAMSALRTRPDARVLLLDRAGFPRDKSCGDGIAPQALDELARVGAADVLADRVPVRRLRIVSPGGVEVVTTLARPDFVVPREVFDARLVAAAVGRGAVLERRTVRRLEVRPDGVVLDGEVHARVVVGADGANGVVRRQVGAPKQPDGAMAVAVRGYAAAPPGEPEQRIVMTARDWPAYAWSFAIGDGTANVGFGMLLPSLRAADRGGRAELHGRLAELLPGVEAERLVSHHLPLSTSRPPLRPGPVLLAGDALSLINPLTGEGIFYALLSGRLAGAAAVSAGDAGACVRRRPARRARPAPAPHDPARTADRPAGARRRRRRGGAPLTAGDGRAGRAGSRARAHHPALAGGLVRQLLPG